MGEESFILHSYKDIMVDAPFDMNVMTSWKGMECYNYSPFVYAYDCENIAITGRA